jgi:outer membrane immunogenic protein
MKLNPAQILLRRSHAAIARVRSSALALMAVMLCSTAYGADYSAPPPLPDYPLRGSETPIARAPTFARWEGFYFGGQYGRSFGSADFSNGTSSMVSYILDNTELQNLVSSWGTLPKASSTTQSYGGFAGYNVQWGEVITGLELNYNHLSYRSSAADSVGPIQVPGANLPDGSTVLYNVTVASTASIAIHDILTTRARFGWVYNNLLPYGFAGLAVGRADVARTASVTGTKSVTDTSTPPVTVTGALLLPRSPQTQAQDGLFAWGFTAGLGLEVGLTPNLFLRAEWEFVQFPNISDMRVTMNTVRAGIGVKF